MCWFPEASFDRILSRTIIAAGAPELVRRILGSLPKYMVFNLNASARAASSRAAGTDSSGKRLGAQDKQA